MRGSERLSYYFQKERNIPLEGERSESEDPKKYQFYSWHLLGLLLQHFCEN